jgi:hypothetical protein
MAGTAFANSNPNGQGLQHNNDVVLLRLSLNEPGLYLIFGRVVIRNDDGDAQAASARSTVKDGADLVDRTDVRIPGGQGTQALHLQGTARVNPGTTEIVDIRCSTFRGFASQSSLLALQIDRLRV